MNLLALGGTGFVGRAITEAALGHGWTVTTFNRGITASDVPGVRVVRGDRDNMDDVDRLATSGPWDAVVDTSGYVPRNVLAMARRLAPLGGQYVFISTVSVYADWPVLPLTEGSPLLACPPDAGPDFGEDVEDGPTRYGYQKAGCEAAARLAFGDARVALLRPGVILGPREYVGRLPWWLRRVAAGGRVAAPGTPGRSIQPVDVRDVADFALGCAQHQSTGAFNVTAPIGRDAFGDLLSACATATGASPDFVWIPESKLFEVGVRQWSEMPLWRASEGVWRVDSTRASTSGLHNRPLVETVRDTWRWLVESGDVAGNERAEGIGLSPEREARLLGTITT